MGLKSARVCRDLFIYQNQAICNKRRKLGGAAPRARCASQDHLTPPTNVKNQHPVGRPSQCCAATHSAAKLVSFLVLNSTVVVWWILYLNLPGNLLLFHFHTENANVALKSKTLSETRISWALWPCAILAVTYIRRARSTSFTYTIIVVVSMSVSSEHYIINRRDYILAQQMLLSHLLSSITRCPDALRAARTQV